jgi:nicotinamidase-related amidase
MDASVSLDPARTALVLGDLLRGIVTTLCRPHKCVEVVVVRAAGGLVAPPAGWSRLRRAGRASGGLVAPVRVGTRPDGRPAAPPDADLVPPVPDSLPADWAELVPEFGSDPRDLVIAKPRWSAFDGTGLDAELPGRGITTLVLGTAAARLRALFAGCAW